MRLLLVVRAALALFLCWSILVPAQAQTNSENPPLKEVEIASNAFSLGDPVPSWVDPVAIPQVTANLPVVIRLADTQLLVASIPVNHSHRAVLVNDAASLSAVGQIAIAFVPQYQHVQLHAIRILRGQEVLDRTTSSTIRFLQRETGLEAGVYSGVVTASILVNDLRVGDTLDFAYSIYGQNPVFGEKFASGVVWDQAFPVSLRRIVLNYPAARRVSWRLLDGEQAKPLVPTESTRDGMQKLVFEQPSLTATHDEAFSPPGYSAFRWLQFSEFAGWDDVVRWASGLFQIEGPLDDGLRDVVEKLRTRPTNEERVVAALEFVQSEIRYFSVALGESSHRPTEPNVVLARRYGDCKDKSLLLIALLKELGIPSEPVLLEFGRRNGLERALPSPGLFNHVIVRVNVDGHFYYLDPTRLGQHGRLDRMGQLHEGTQILLIDRDARQLSTISSANVADLVYNEVSETATLPKFGADGELHVRQRWNGLAAEAARILIERQPREQIVKSLGEALESRYPGSKLKADPEIQDDRVNNTVTVVTRYAVPKLAVEREGNWFVPFKATNVGGALVSPPSPTRAGPLTVPRFPYVAKYSFEVTFPEEVSAVSDPSARTVEDKYFAYTAMSSFRGNLSKTTIDLKTLKPQVEVVDIQKFGEDLRSADDAVKGAVVVAKAWIKPAGSANGDTKDFAQSLRDRLRESIDKTTETIKSGKLTGSDLAEAYCSRGATYSDLDQVDDALRDTNEALKIAPNSTKMISCRAEVYFHSGAFEKSIDEYSHAVTLGATRSMTFAHRGISRFYAGQLEDAADDFAKASDADDTEAQLYNDLWLTWTYQRLGRPLPDAVAKRAVADPRGEWPRPALAMLTGHLSPEEMLKLVERKSGDDRQMTLAEAYFYVAQHYLVDGDKAKAREYLEKTRQLDVAIYTEHVAALFELNRLKGVR